MKKYQSNITRRHFLSASALGIFSQCLIKGFSSFFRTADAKASEQPGGSEFQNRNDDWLNLTPESAIEPNLPICDSHHHLWSTTSDVYLMEDFISDISGGHNIIKTVFVEAYGMNQQRGTKKMEPIEYTEFVVTETSRIKFKTDVGAGIVGYADLMIGNAVIPLLESHIAVSKGKFRGIRLAPGSVLSDSKFKEGFSNLSKYGLSCDAFGNKYTDLISLARSFPDTHIIVNHIGNPSGIGAGDENAAEVLQEWRNAIKELASCHNIYIKLGGLGMNSFKFGWNSRPVPVDSDELAMLTSPYFNYCIEQFGAERCMFESNWPVDKESFSYNILWNAFKKMTKHFSSSERSALFHDTAIKVYRI